MRSLMPITSGSSDEIINMAMPSSARARRRSWIADLAPTSMPRVGSSKSMTVAFVASHFGEHDLLLVAAAQQGDRLAGTAGAQLELA